MTGLLDLATTQLAAGGVYGPRRACWLARSALEEALDALLAAAGLDLGPLASTRSRLSCLEVAYAETPGLAARAQYAWSRLSEACHQHAYQLSPTHAEVADLLNLVTEVGDAVKH